MVGSQVVAGTLKPRRLLSRMVLTDSPAGCWLPAGTEPGRNGHNQGAALLAENWSYPLLANFRRLCCADLMTGSQPASHKQGGRVACVVRDWLRLID